MNIDTSTTVVAIVVICYLIGMICKAIKYVPDEVIPTIVGISGGILGILGMNIISGFPADDVMSAAAVGIISGLASTGANQLIKSLK